MGDLSKHFNRREFICKCGCGKDTVDAELLQVLEAIRTEFSSPIKINSGNRCEVYNKRVGGSHKSQHLLSKAADIVVQGHLPRDVVEWLDKVYPDKYGVGKYVMFTHIDVREKRSRWHG